VTGLCVSAYTKERHFGNKHRKLSQQPREAMECSSCWLNTARKCNFRIDDNGAYVAAMKRPHRTTGTDPCREPSRQKLKSFVISCEDNNSKCGGWMRRVNGRPECDESTAFTDNHYTEGAVDGRVRVMQCVST
jgi:hypothetical protein